MENELSHDKLKIGYGETRKTCVICEERYVDPINWKDGQIVEAKDLVVCFACRVKHKPGCITEDQYCRYWKAFSIKWRKGNE